MKRKKSKSKISSKFFAVALVLIILILFVRNPLLNILVVFISILSVAVFLALKIIPKISQYPKTRSVDLSQVDGMTGKAFEHYVAELLRYRGFQTEITRASGDLGVDIIASYGGIKYAIQCKRHSSDLSRTAVSDAVAGKNHYKCQVPVVVTNRFFRKGAKTLAQSNKCILIDRDTLAQWINDYREGNPSLKILN